MSRKLRPLNKKDIHWAERNVPYFVGCEYNMKVTCMHCGTKFGYKGGEKQMCPHCRRELNIRQSLARKYDDTECFLLADSVGDWQVLRYFHVITNCTHRGKNTYTNIHEVLQRWIDSRGRYVIRSVSRSGMYPYQWRWAYGTPFETRKVQKGYLYHRWDEESYCELRIRKMSPRLKYAAYDKEVYGDFFNYCKTVFFYPYAETLYKMGCRKLLKHCIDRRELGCKDTISAVKVALRHGYDIESNVKQWFDYIYTLLRLGKDIRNPVLVCPTDLNAAEQKCLRILGKRETDRRKREEYEERLRRLEKDKRLNEAYAKKYGKLFGVVIADGGISIHVLKDVDEFAREGSELHHCVYACSYYDIDRHPYSLILDASVNGKRTETIEVDTRDFHIVQARGACNQDSEYHSQIVELVNNNIEQFKQITV